MSGDIGNIEISPPTIEQVQAPTPAIETPIAPTVSQNPESLESDIDTINSIRNEIRQTGDVNPEATARMFEDIKKKEEEEAQRLNGRSPLKRIANAVLDLIGVK